MPTAEEKERAKLGIRARRDAERDLREKHKDEFEKMVEDNRLALGLSRKSGGLSPEVVEEKMRRAKERLEKLERLLEEAKADQAPSRSR